MIMKIHLVLLIVFTIIAIYCFYNMMAAEWYIYTTYGTSMLPIITPNSTVYCVPLSNYSIGDIVAYINPWTNEKMLHRIIYKQDDYYVIQGDNLDNPDPGVMTTKDIICKVTKIIKNN